MSTVTWIAANARVADQHELLCQVGTDNVTVPAAICVESSPPSMRWVARWKGKPVAAWGVAHNDMITPTVGSLWLFGTDDIRRVIPAVSRAMARDLPRMTEERGITRLEIRALATHDIAHRWLERLGARRVCTLTDWGSSGEEFVLYEWTRAIWERAKKEGSTWLSKIV